MTSPEIALCVQIPCPTTSPALAPHTPPRIPRRKRSSMNSTRPPTDPSRPQVLQPSPFAPRPKALACSTAQQLHYPIFAPLATPALTQQHVFTTTLTRRDQHGYGRSPLQLQDCTALSATSTPPAPAPHTCAAPASRLSEPPDTAVPATTSPAPNPPKPLSTISAKPMQLQQHTST